MNSNYSQEILQLSVAERLALLEQVWDSLHDEETDVLLTPEQEAELDRRLDEHEAHPEDTFSWDEVRTHVLARLGTR